MKSIKEYVENMLEKSNAFHLYEEHIEIKREGLIDRLLNLDEYINVDIYSDDKKYSLCSRFTSEKIAKAAIKKIISLKETILNEWWNYSSIGDRISLRIYFTNQIGEAYVKGTSFKTEPYPMYGVYLMLQKDAMLDWKIVTAYPIPNMEISKKIEKDKEAFKTKKHKNAFNKN